MRPIYRRTRAATLLLVAIISATILANPVSAFSPSAASAGASQGGTDLVQLVQEGATGATLELAASKLTLASPTAATPDQAAPVAGCLKLEAAGMALTSDAGRPQLPVKSVLLGAPPGAELELNVTSGQVRTVASGISVCPAAVAPSSTDDGNAPADSLAAQGVSLDAQVYGENAFYPADTVRVIDMGYMRSQRIVRVEFYPFQYNPVTGEVRQTEQIRADLAFVGGSGVPVAEPDEWETSFREMLINYASASQLRASTEVATTSSLMPAAVWTPPQPGYKISVKEAGIYHLTQAWLAAAGLPVDQLDPRTFRLFNGGAEIAIRVVGEEDGKFDAADEVVFYGQGVDTRYTDTNIYWLTYGGSQGMRMGARSSASGGTQASSFLTTVKKEDNTTYDSNLPMLPGYDHWFGQQIQAIGQGKTGAVSVSVASPQLAQGGSTARVSVFLGAVTMGSHHVRLYVNPGTYAASVGEGTWDGATVKEVAAEFPSSQLNPSGANTIKIEVINEFSGRAADILRVDWVQVGYQRLYLAEGGKLIFDGDSTGARRYSVGGYTTPNVDLYDITDPAHVVRITGATVGKASSSIYLPLVVNASKGGASSTASITAAAVPSAAAALNLQFGDNQATARRYAGWDRAQEMTPLAIALDQPSSLQATNQGADYIIVTHADFAAAVQPLADYRASQGLRVRVVDVQDVYDEFGGGLMSAEAIRDFVAYAYNNWPKPAPSYLLLVGDGTYDFRHYQSTAPTFVPPYLAMVDPDAGETATDNRFVAVTANDILPDLNVGRLPANTAAEATAMVNKILAYEGQSKPWTKQVLFVTDDLEGGGGDFYAYSDGIADGTAMYNGSEVKILPADYTANKVYLGKTCDLSNPTTSVECRAQIINKINSGSLMVSYVGHGVKTYWAAEHLYDATALSSLTNAGKLPVMLPMTCNEGYFIDPAESSLSEIGVRMENKGAIASWAPTGFGLAPGHDYLERGLFLAVFQDGKALGSGATAAKLYLVANAPPNTYTDLIDTFLLLGDPALRVK